jgi:lysozyme
MPFVKGIDVSVYDPLVNWAKVRQQGYRFAYIRSSYGVSNNQTRMDTMFPSHWAGTKAAGVLRGAYHYLRASQDGAKQAKEYLKIVNPQPGDLPAALDLEEAFNQDATNAQFIKNAEAFLKTIKEETGVKPVVYSRAFFLKEKVSQPNGKAPSWARQYRSWVAHWTYAYGENIKPIEAEGWSPYAFWQYSGEKEYLAILCSSLPRCSASRSRLSRMRITSLTRT